MLQTDEKRLYTFDYPDAGECNYTMEIKATKDGLQINELSTVPWDWILRALATFHEEEDSRVR
jgi:hypothetical protein